MTWYIRKSVSIGPVRFNLSKSGIGTSVGVKGFRVGVRPNGSSYMHAGRHGFYYREELGRKFENKQTNYNDSNTLHYNSATSQELKPTSRKELLAKLTKSYKSIRLDYICGVLFVIFAGIQYGQNKNLGIVILVVGVLTTILVAIWESRRRTVSIVYDFENDNTKNFKKIISAFNNLASNRSVWTLIDSTSIYGSHESKLNAGAGNLVNKSVAKIGEGKPPWVKTNINVPVLKSKNLTLYMMPDGILIYDIRGVGFVEYNDISFQHGTSNFIEEKPPNDAEILYHTWKYPNKDGGPDRRFNNNYNIPVCLYGELKIKSNSGLFLYLMTSKHETPVKFVNEFNKMKESLKKSVYESKKETRLTKNHNIVDKNFIRKNRMKASYSATRLTFKKEEIEKLDWEDKIRIYVSNDRCTYEMTKRQFYKTFDNVVKTKSYKEYGNYNYHPTPSKAFKYIVNK